MALVMVLTALPLLAKKITADQVQVSTPVYTPAANFKTRPGRYDYSVTWNGIPAASIELELARQDEDYLIRSQARTAKGVDLVFMLRYESETVLSAETLKPKRSYSVTRTNERKKITELEFCPDGQIISTRENHRGRVKTLQFDPANFTLDPYSTGFLALSQNWRGGQSRRFDLFSGKSRYLVTFTAVERTRLTIKGQERPAMVLVPEVTNLTDPGEDADDKKLRQARIYISVDQPREILKVSSTLLFGNVEAELSGFTATSPPAPVDGRPGYVYPVIAGQFSNSPVSP